MTSFPRALRAGGTALALLLACAVAVRFANRTPAPRDVNAPATEFSAGRAMRLLHDITTAPHPAGSANHEAVRAYLMARLTQLGLAPQVQDVTGVGTRFAVAGRVRNVLARLPGTQPGGKAVLLVAHYDAVPASMGAGDDGAGVVAILETIRALRAGAPLRNDVIVLLTDAEENGMLGAAAFAQQHPWAKDVGVILNFEGRGTDGPSLMFQTGDGNLGVARALRSAPYANSTSLSVSVYRRMPNDTDLSELLLLGVPAMNFAFIGGVNRYHTAQDDITHVAPSSVEHHGEQMLALVRTFGNEALPRAATPDAVFFTLPLLGVVSYAAAWAIPIALLAIALLVVVTVRGRGQPRWWRDVAAGAGVTVATFVACVIVASVVMSAVDAFHAARPLGGNPDWTATYALALALLVTAISLGTYALARRWADAAAMHVGALWVWGAFAALFSVVLPGGSFLYAIPVLAMVIVAAIPTSSPRLGYTLLWLATLVTLFIVVPIVYQMAFVALGVGKPGAMLIGLLGALTLWLLAPHMEDLRLAGAWAAPSVAVAAAAVCFAIGLTTERTSVRRPTGAFFAYARDVDAPAAWLSGAATPASAATWLRQSLRRVGQDTGAQPPGWLTAMFGSRSMVPVAAAEMPGVPILSLVSDSAGADSRRVTVRVRPGAPGTLAIYVAPDSGSVRGLRVDGLAVSSAHYRGRSWPLQYVAPSDSGFTLSFEIGAREHVVLGATSRVTGIPLTAAQALPARPAGIIPLQLPDVSVIHARLRI